MSTRLKARRASSRDLPLLASWNRRLIRDEGHRNPMGLAQLKRRMAAWLKGGGYRALLFEEEGLPLGYALYREEKGFIYLRQFFIDRKFRRRGSGRRALALMSGRPGLKGKRLVLEVLVHNRRAMAFWKATGFKPYALTLEKGKA